MNTFSSTTQQLKVAQKPAPKVEAIIPEAMYRWSEAQKFLPYKRERWRQLVKAGKAPAPIKLTSACVAWRGADLLKWLANPMDYQVDSTQNV